MLIKKHPNMIQNKDHGMMMQGHDNHWEERDWTPGWLSNDFMADLITFMTKIMNCNTGGKCDGKQGMSIPNDLVGCICNAMWSPDSDFDKGPICESIHDMRGGKDLLKDVVRVIKNVTEGDFPELSDEGLANQKLNEMVAEMGSQLLDMIDMPITKESFKEVTKKLKAALEDIMADIADQSDNEKDQIMPEVLLDLATELTKMNDGDAEDLTKALRRIQSKPIS